MGQRRRAGCRCNCHCRWECVGRLLGASQLAAAAETWWAAALVGARLCRAPSRCSCSAAAALAKRPWRVAAADTCTCARERPTKGWRGPLCGACFAVAAVAVGRRPPAQLGRSIRRRLRARRHCGEAALAWGKVCSRAVPISHFHLPTPAQDRNRSPRPLQQPWRTSRRMGLARTSTRWHATARAVGVGPLQPHPYSSAVASAAAARLAMTVASFASPLPIPPAAVAASRPQVVYESGDVPQPYAVNAVPGAAAAGYADDSELLARGHPRLVARVVGVCGAGRRILPRALGVR